MFRVLDALIEKLYPKDLLEKMEEFKNFPQVFALQEINVHRQTKQASKQRLSIETEPELRGNSSQQSPVDNPVAQIDSTSIRAGLIDVNEEAASLQQNLNRMVATSNKSFGVLGEMESMKNTIDQMTKTKLDNVKRLKQVSARLSDYSRPISKVLYS